MILFEKSDVGIYIRNDIEKYVGNILETISEKISANLLKFDFRFIIPY